MGATLSTFSGAMKTKFIGPIRDQLHSNKILLFGLRDKQDEGASSLPTGSREFKGIQPLADGIDFVGNEFRIPLRTSRNQGVGSRGENQLLPAPGREGFRQISEPLHYHYGLFSITGQLLKASEKNEGAFKQALSVEMNGTVDALKRKMNIDAYGVGDGTLVKVRDTAATTNTIPVETTVHFQGGEIVDIEDVSAGTLIAAARTVTGVDRAARTVTISGAAVSVDADDRLIRASSDSTIAEPNNEDGEVINGLQNIIDDQGTLHGVDPSVEIYWRSSVIDAQGAQVGDSLLRQLTDAVGFESGDDDEMVLITTRGIRNLYANSLTSLKRFNDAQATTLRGGFKALMFDDNKPMVVDDHCPPGNVFAINTDAMFWSQNSDWEWMDMDGEVLKWEPRYDRYIGILFKYANLGTHSRNRHGRIINAEDDVR